MLRSLAGALGALPLGVRRSLGAALGTALSLFPTRDREIARLQLTLALGEAAPSIAAVYRHVGIVGLEALDLDPLRKDPERYIDLEPIRRHWAELKDGAPVIALSAHTGNWELFASSVAWCGIPLTAIGQEAKNAEWQSLLKHIRERYGNEIIWRSDSGGVKMIVKALQERRVLAALMDQDTNIRSELIPFFGRPASVPSTLIDLGQRMKAVFLSAFIVRERDGRYGFRIERLPSDAPARELLAEYHRRLEAVIREFPEQWVWFHKRWRTLEGGERLRSKAYLEHLRRTIGVAAR